MPPPSLLGILRGSEGEALLSVLQHRYQSEMRSHQWHLGLELFRDGVSGTMNNEAIWPRVVELPTTKPLGSRFIRAEDSRLCSIEQQQQTTTKAYKVRLREAP